jgi:hypothetical protein
VDRDQHPQPAAETQVHAAVLGIVSELAPGAASSSDRSKPDSATRPRAIA